MHKHKDISRDTYVCTGTHICTKIYIPTSEAIYIHIYNMQINSVFRKCVHIYSYICTCTYTKLAQLYIYTYTEIYIHAKTMADTHIILIPTCICCQKQVYTQSCNRVIYNTRIIYLHVYTITNRVVYTHKYVHTRYIEIHIHKTNTVSGIYIQNIYIHKTNIVSGIYIQNIYRYIYTTQTH